MIVIKKGVGVLLHVSSLPNKYGIGTFGKAAYDFVDFLKSGNMRYWQVLPLVQTGYGDSPYQSVYSASGNPYFIDLPMLVKDGLLTEEELVPMICESDYIDYEFLSREKYAVLRLAFSRFDKNEKKFVKFVKGGLFRYYALFMALKEKFNGARFCDWEKKYKYAEESALIKFEKENYNEYLFWLFLQYEFLSQWKKLKKYANSNGIKIIGDLPLYVAYDSVDVWQNPKLFKLNADRSLKKVAGVPPDYFSETGQLWGNPVYRWSVHKKDNYAWWINRLKQAFSLYDVVRLDHFRGFDRYFEIDYGAETAEYGKWQSGPKTHLFIEAEKQIKNCEFIAEDLGLLDKGVYKLIEKTGYPNMKVIEFAFDGNDDNPYLPSNINENSVCYTGTHDNDTLLGYIDGLHGIDFYNFCECIKKQTGKDFNYDKRAMAEEMVSLALNSKSKVRIIPVQDMLLLNASARMNTPATVGKNWAFRLKELPDKNSVCEPLKKYFK